MSRDEIDITVPIEIGGSDLDWPITNRIGRSRSLERGIDIRQDIEAVLCWIDDRNVRPAILIEVGNCRRRTIPCAAVYGSGSERGALLRCGRAGDLDTGTRRFVDATAGCHHGE